MKIAYLILCHKNLPQVEALISKLGDSYCDFYIHIDRKLGDTANIFLDNTFVVPYEKRINVKWGHYSMIQAEMALISLIQKRGIEYDYVCLLSGQDLPLKSNKYILDFFQNNYGKKFINIVGKWDQQYMRFLKRNVLYYPNMLFQRNLIGKIMRRLYIEVTGGYRKTFKLFQRKNASNYDFYFGSQWWILTYECLMWMKDWIDKHKEYSVYFYNAMTPDESFFQTVFMLSPFVNTRRDNLTYIKWERGNHPKLLGKEDYKELIKTGKLFARKFDIDALNEIIGF